MSLAIDVGIATTPCIHCGQEVSIYPPEDGTGPYRCGQCAGTAVAVPARIENSAITNQQHVHHPHREPRGPQLDPKDRPDPAWLREQREQATRRTGCNRTRR